MLLKDQLREAGHASRVEGHRLRKIAMCGEISTGRSERVAPKKDYKDCLRKSSPHVMLTLCGCLTWQRTVVPGAIRSSTWSTSLSKTEEMHKIGEKQR